LKSRHIVEHVFKYKDFKKHLSYEIFIKYTVLDVDSAKLDFNLFENFDKI